MKSPARKNECVALCLPRRSRNASSEYGNCRKEKASRLNWMGKKFDSKRINIYQQRSYFARESSCAGHRKREHCALSAMLTVSQLSKFSLPLEVRFGESGIRPVVASNRSESRWSDLDSALGLASLARATSGHGRPFPNALCTDNLQSSDRYR